MGIFGFGKKKAVAEAMNALEKIRNIFESVRTIVERGELRTLPVGRYAVSDITNTIDELSGLLRTAASYEDALVKQVDVMESELKKIGGIKEFRDLTEAEQSAIAFSAEIGSEIQNLIKKIAQLSEATKTENSAKYKTTLNEIKETVYNMIEQFRVLERLFYQIERIKTKRSAA
ncbi:MAG: hypothetical protein QXR48_00905 [Candidatus Woesearchaeota archaeon]